jgi:hypothetical protein
MRDLINLLNESGLTPAVLAQDNGKYLRVIIQFANSGLPLQIDPGSRAKIAQAAGVDEPVIDAQIDPAIVPALERSLASGNIKATLPPLSLIVGDKKIKANWGDVFKSPEIKTALGAKEYNTGHLAELCMGLSITAKFSNLGSEINMQQVMAVIGTLKIDIPPESSSFRLTTTQTITYPEVNSKTDTLKFFALVPGASAESFFKQAKAGKFASDIHAVLNSANLFVNESGGVPNACNPVRQDQNNNTIEVVSDGTSDATSTKADLVLKVDGSKVNLLSLKTYSTNTLGQMSGVSFQAINKFFSTAFGLDLSKYQSYFDETLPKETVFKNIIKLYDTVVIPAVKELISNHSPGQESAIVRQLAKAANIFARGEGLEDVEVVKLDDEIAEGNYKILRFSDDLYDTMKMLDLEMHVVDTGENGRTIQILVKPDPNLKDKNGKPVRLSKKANTLCRLRTQLKRGYARNEFESGEILEKLTRIDQMSESIRPEVEEPHKVYGNEKTLGRKRQR